MYRRSVNAGRFYTICHLPLTYFMVLVGAGLKVLLVHSHYELHRSEVWLLGGSLAIVVALILLVRMSHRGWRSELGLLRSSDPGFVIASNGRCQRARAEAAAAATKSEPTHPHIAHTASAPNLTHNHVEHAPVHLPDGTVRPV